MKEVVKFGNQLNDSQKIFALLKLLSCPNFSKNQSNSSLRVLGRCCSWTKHAWCTRSSEGHLVSLSFRRTRRVPVALVLRTRQSPCLPRLLGASVLALPVRYAPASVPVMSPFAFDLHKQINSLLDCPVEDGWC
jgi:hypothetical protein